MIRNEWLKLGAISLTLSAMWACGEASIPDQDDPLIDERFDAEVIGQGLTKGSVGATNGDEDFCDDPGNLCGNGEGDCDTDAQCQAGSYCGLNNGAQFGMPAAHDVCIPTHCKDGLRNGDETGLDCGGAFCKACPTLTNGHPAYCKYYQCVAGEGDCNSDADCFSDTYCGTDNGPQFGMPAGYDVCIPNHCKDGVLSGDEAGVDCGGSFCAACPTLAPGHPDYCNFELCDVGEGDCDSDAQCQAGLVCARKGSLYGFSSTTDVCVVPHCANNVIDVDSGEIGRDCGGPNCAPCNKIRWSKIIASPNAEYIRGMAVSAVGDVYVTGYFSGTLDLGAGPMTSAGSNDIFVAKYNNSDGSLAWSKSFGGTGDDRAYDIAINGADTALVLVGGFKSPSFNFGLAALTNQGGEDGFISALDLSGTPFWAKSFGAAGADRYNAVSIDTDNNIYAVGDFSGTVNLGPGALVSAGGTDIILAKYGVFGNVNWTKGFGGNINDFGRDVGTYSNTQVAFIGNSGSASIDLGKGALAGLGKTDVVIGNYNTSNGSPRWTQRMGGSDLDVAESITFEPNSYITITGSFYGSASFGGPTLTSAGLADVFVTRLRNTGFHYASARFGGAGFDSASTAVAFGSDYYILGYFQDGVDFGNGSLSVDSNVETDIFLLKLNIYLAFKSIHRFGGPGLDFGRALTITSTSIFLAGTFVDSIDPGTGLEMGAGGDDGFIVKMDF